MMNVSGKKMGEGRTPSDVEESQSSQPHSLPVYPAACEPVPPSGQLLGTSTVCVCVRWCVG